MLLVGNKDNSSKKIECNESNNFSPIKFGRKNNTASNVIKIFVGDKNNKAKEIYFMPLYDLRYNLPVYSLEGDIYNNAVEVVATYKNDLSGRDPKNPLQYIDTLYFNSIRRDVPSPHILNLFNNKHINRYSKYINAIHLNNYEDLNIEYHGLCGTDNIDSIDMNKIFKIENQEISTTGISRKITIKDDNNIIIKTFTGYTIINSLCISSVIYDQNIRIVLTNGNCMRIKTYVENPENYEIVTRYNRPIIYEKLSDGTYKENSSIEEGFKAYLKLKNFDGYITKDIYDRLKDYKYTDNKSFIIDFFGMKQDYNGAFNYITHESNFYDDLLGQYFYNTLYHIILHKNISNLNGCFRLTPKLKSVFIENQNLNISDEYKSFDVTDNGCIILWKKESLNSTIPYDYTKITENNNQLLVYPCVENSKYIDGCIAINIIKYEDNETTYTDTKIQSLDYVNLYNDVDSINAII